MDVIQVDIDHAKQSLIDAQKDSQASLFNENVYKSIIAVSRALLVILGHEPKKDREIVKLFTKEFIDAGWVSPDARNLLEAAIDWKLGDVDTICNNTKLLEELVSRVEKLFLSLDAGLKFTIEPLTAKLSEQQSSSQASKIDLRGVGCPLNFVKAKLALEKVDIGQTLEVLLDDGEPVKNVPASFTGQGQEVLEIEKQDDHFKVLVKRKK